MSRLWTMLLVFWAVALPGYAQEVPEKKAASESRTPVRLLFIGNSYTGGVRSTVQKALQSAPSGQEYQLQFVNPGGRQLRQHLENASLLKTIDEGNWDYVVLQEQSQVPSLPSPYREQFMASSAHLCKRIQAAGSTPVFFMTWGRRDGDKKNPQVNPDFSAMQQRLADSYRQAASKNKAVLLPVGEAFASLHKQDKPLWLALYKKDGSHPSSKGGAVFTCVLCKALLTDEFERLEIPGVSPEELKRMKRAAETAVSTSSKAKR